MEESHSFSKLARRITVQSVLALFLIPALTFWFSGHILSNWDQEFTAAVNSQVAREANLGEADKAAAALFVKTNKPSVLCSSGTSARMKVEQCAFFSELWQVSTARQWSFWALIGGGLLLLTVAGLSAAAFARRSVQYASFVSGWRLMSVACAAVVIAQGVMLVWLSFWLTAFYTQKYFPKLIILAAIIVGIGVFMAVVGIFKRQKLINQQSGELVQEADAPRLWARIREMAQRLRTEPPKQIVAGIDANFFVTEAPLLVGDQQLEGRSLYVSIPLLRKMQPEEADAVLGHELAHLSGGDTRNSAKLGPSLVSYDHYCASMRQGMTWVVWPLLALYRLVFELALARASREREFQADRVAAQLVAPQAITQALVKVAAYSMYRSKVENTLFEQQVKHTGALGIAAQVDKGLSEFVASSAFVDAIKTAHVPHPFDSHPPLHERAKAVGVPITEADYSRIALQQPEQSWVAYMNTADAIEQRLWGAYDEAFAAQHEHSLAYRYEPANDAERDIVLKYFPQRSFNLKNDATVQISYEGISVSASNELIHWDAVKDLRYQEGSFGDSLTVTLNEKGLIGSKTQTVKLPGIGKQKDEFTQVLGAYYQRHQIMRAQSSAAT
jgi:Zn-dependent protease with chaperone function